MTQTDLIQLRSEKKNKRLFVINVVYNFFQQHCFVINVVYHCFNNIVMSSMLYIIVSTTLSCHQCCISLFQQHCHVINVVSTKISTTLLVKFTLPAVKRFRPYLVETCSQFGLFDSGSSPAKFYKNSRKYLQNLSKHVLDLIAPLVHGITNCPHAINQSKST